MTDLERSLRDRLRELTDAVPVGEPPALATDQRAPARRTHRPRRLVIAPAAMVVLVAGVAIAAAVRHDDSPRITSSSDATSGGTEAASTSNSETVTTTATTATTAAVTTTSGPESVPPKQTGLLLQPTVVAAFQSTRFIAVPNSGVDSSTARVERWTDAGWVEVGDAAIASAAANTLLHGTLPSLEPGSYRIAVSNDVAALFEVCAACDVFDTAPPLTGDEPLVVRPGLVDPSTGVVEVGYATGIEPALPVITAIERWYGFEQRWMEWVQFPDGGTQGVGLSDAILGINDDGIYRLVTGGSPSARQQLAVFVVSGRGPKNSLAFRTTRFVGVDGTTLRLVAGDGAEQTVELPSGPFQPNLEYASADVIAIGVGGEVYAYDPDDITAPARLLGEYDNVGIAGFHGGYWAADNPGPPTTEPGQTVTWRRYDWNGVEQPGSAATLPGHTVFPAAGTSSSFFGLDGATGSLAGGAVWPLVASGDQLLAVDGGDLVRLDRDGSITVLAYVGATAMPPETTGNGDVSPDGQQFAILLADQERDPTPVLVVGPFDGSSPPVTNAMPTGEMYKVHWLGDGGSVVVSGLFQTYVLDVQRGEFAYLHTLPMGVLWWALD